VNAPSFVVKRACNIDICSCVGDDHNLRVLGSMDLSI